MHLIVLIFLQHLAVSGIKSKRVKITFKKLWEKLVTYISLIGLGPHRKWSLQNCSVTIGTY
jgi:hypothetical protein